MTVFDRFGLFWVFLGCFWWFWVAYQKYRIRRTKWLAPSPPSKIKSPWRFFTRPGKNPSLVEIPYQSPKKCLKTQITTFSILKFSPKAKNTPVLTVFTLFLPSSSCLCHHPVTCAFWRFHGARTISSNHHRVSSCRFSDPQSQNLSHKDQLAAFFAFLRPFRPFSEIPWSAVRF